MQTFRDSFDRNAIKLGIFREKALERNPTLTRNLVLSSIEKSILIVEYRSKRS